MSEPLRASQPEEPAPGGGAAPAEPVPVDGPPEEIARQHAEQAEAEAAVLAVMEREQERARRLALVENRRRRPAPLRLLLLGALVALNLYMWLGNPAWLTFHEPPAPSIDFYEGSWKIAVYLEAQRIDEYRRTRGEVPSTAQQAGPTVRGVQYTPLARTDYRLAAGSGPRAVVYHSTQPLGDWVGRSLLRAGLIAGGVR